MDGGDLAGRLGGWGRSIGWKQEHKARGERHAQLQEENHEIHQ
jgi:hypothetical protein